MQLTQKHIIAISIVAIIAMIGYGSFQKNTPPSQSDGMNINPISQSGIETDSIKRIETVANSGTQWGISPFGSGKPLEEAEKKPVFQKPNTEWKTRTLSGITYVFGEGNPSGVALPESALIACNMQDASPCNDNDAGYVDPILEKLVYDVLSSPDWESLLQNCENDFRIVDTVNQTSSEPPILTYERVLNLTNYISLEQVFVVNTQTGRKNITKEGYGKLMGLYQYIRMGTSDFDGNPLPGITKCVDTYGVNIANKFANIRWLPWRGSKDAPASQ